MAMQGIPLVIKPEAYFACRDERDHLRAINAELVTALVAIVNNDLDVLGEPTTAYQEVVRMARAALAKARKEG